MNIVMVTPQFVNKKTESLTGMPRYVYKITRFLQEYGHNVEIVAASSNDKTWRYEGVVVHNIKWSGNLHTTPVVVSIGILKREIAIQKKLRQLDTARKIDIVQYAGWSGNGCMHSLRCPAVLRLSTYSKVQYVQHNTMKDYIKTYSFWERMSGRRADGIIAPGKMIGEQFSKDVRKKVTIMETPYDNQVAEDSTVYDTQLTQKKYILYYGTFTTDKGFQVITNMLPRLLREDGELFFVCAGWNVATKSGSALQDMRQKLGENQHRMLYLGVLNQQQLYPIIRHAEAVLIPSLVDNLPNTCLEALALDKIVVGTYGTSLEQMIDDGENGFLSEPGNAESLLQAVRKALKMTEQEKKEMVRKNRQRIKKYEPDAAVKKLERYYRWLILRKEAYLNAN